MVVNKDFWTGKKVLITGHTGFKGSWLSLWMQHLSAEIIGVSLDPPSTPNLFEEANVADDMITFHQDIRDGEAIKKIFLDHEPEIVFHLAAQPLVLYSYQHPVETYTSNIIGTMHILEAIRSINTVKAAVLITSDKCYENREWEKAYTETEPMGGCDPYSSSKGAAELLIAAYRKSYFSDKQFKQHITAIASARAGNVIGGGDWAQDRLIPDILRALEKGLTISIRNPDATRPWQHVLEPLAGYLTLAELLYSEGNQYAEAWNFGSPAEDTKPVNWIVKHMIQAWGEQASWIVDTDDYPKEANYLKLDCSKAQQRLHWYPRWNLEMALEKVIEWHQERNNGSSPKEICINQIVEYQNTE